MTDNREEIHIDGQIDKRHTWARYIQNLLWIDKQVDIRQADLKACLGDTYRQIGYQVDSQKQKSSKSVGEKGTQI